MLMNVWNDVVVENGASNTERLANFFLACRSGANPPLWNMVKTVFNEIEKTTGSIQLAPLKTACVEAEKHSNNPYHNEHHNREVTLVTSLLLLKHITDGNEDGFTARDARNLIMAAAVHDLGHDGGGNIVNGVHNPLRLELQALNLAANLWKDQDVTKEDLRFIQACIEPTDISSSEKIVSPRSSLVETFNGASSKASVYNNKMWRTAAAMLSDADLAISAALSPDLFAVNSMMVEEETKGAVPATKASAKYFLDRVVSPFPLSSEGRVLLKTGYNKVRASVFGV